ncbi:hypothetical protein EXIGLDRAFT_589808, partial [Exidia glandulosa HHB12029]
CAICAYPATSRCSGCTRVFYCSQGASFGWENHKRLCKIYQRQRAGESIPADTYCGLCGKTGGRFMKTRCCNRTICNGYEDGWAMGYSHGSCARNHDRYTRCSWHADSEHGGDMLSCEACDNHCEASHSYSLDAEMAAWYMTNNFNFR